MVVLNVHFKDGKEEKINCWVFTFTPSKDLIILFDDDKPERRIKEGQYIYFGVWSK